MKHNYRDYIGENWNESENVYRNYEIYIAQRWSKYLNSQLFAVSAGLFNETGDV